MYILWAFFRKIVYIFQNKQGVTLMKDYTHICIVLDA